MLMAYGLSSMSYCVVHALRSSSLGCCFDGLRLFYSANKFFIALRLNSSAEVLSRPPTSFLAAVLSASDLLY